MATGSTSTLDGGDHLYVKAAHVFNRALLTKCMLFKEPLKEPQIALAESHTRQYAH
jgi:hypothetical protein